MKKFAASVLVIVFGVACRSAASSADFAAIEEEWMAALQRHDTAVLDRLLDPSFLDSTFRGGIRTKADMLSGPPAGAGYRHLRFEDLNVRRFGGDTAVVTGVNVLQGATPGEIVRVRLTDVFVSRGGAWRAVSAQETVEAR